MFFEHNLWRKTFFFSIQPFLLFNLSLSLRFIQWCLFRGFCSGKKTCNIKKKQNYANFFANKYIHCSGLVKDPKTKKILFIKGFSPWKWNKKRQNNYQVKFMISSFERSENKYICFPSRTCWGVLIIVV